MTELKHFFDEARYRTIADELRRLEPAFDAAVFLRMTLEGLDERSLMARMRRTAEAVEAALPGTYEDKLTVLRQLAPRIRHGFVPIFLAEFVALSGRDDFPRSMEALKFFTAFGSSEFAVREFLERDQERALAVMHEWALDSDEHVRRLASEGCRPRLPWGRRLQRLVRDPSPLRPLLEALAGDPSPYVRRSVANHLNDIAKDHPEFALEIVEGWDLSDARRAWIAHRALRTLVKRGDPRALRVFGAGEKPQVKARLAIKPRRLRLGMRLTMTAEIVSGSESPQQLVVDYVIHYRRAGGRTAAKVFKWRRVELAAGAGVVLTRGQAIRDFTTRKHLPGRHRVDLQVNGTIAASSAFLLQGPGGARTG